MLDTNVLVSALLFPSKQMDTMMAKIISQRQLVLSSYVESELLDVVTEIQ